MEQPLIQFKDVSKRFGDNTVLDGVNLSIFRGQVTTIIGKSGVGKSVLLKHIIGLMAPDTGTILFDGRPLSDMPRAERRRHQRKFSYMFQGTALFDSMTVYENVALPLVERTRLRDTEIRRRVNEKMQALDLYDVDAKFPSQLSGGMTKRVALARALVTEPEIVLFDEPTTGLDPIRKNAVHGMIAEYQKRFGFTGVIVSHEIPDIFYISQRVAMLEEGRIFVEGTPEEIQTSPELVVQNFIHGLTAPDEEFAGMKSRVQCENRYLQEAERQRRSGIPFSVVTFTFENIDRLYDTVGHVVGQNVMKHFTDRLQARLRITDSACQYGLNRVVLILAGTGEQEGAAFCRALAEEWKGTTLISGKVGVDVCFTISAGAAQPEEGDTLDQAVAKAISRQHRFEEFQIC